MKIPSLFYAFVHDRLPSPGCFEDVYVDAKRETYKALGFKRFGLLGTLWTVFSKKGRNATAEVCTAARTEPRNFLPTTIVVLVFFFYLAI